VDKFAASSERPKAKSVSASGSAPGPRWGLRPSPQQKFFKKPSWTVTF